MLEITNVINVFQIDSLQRLVSEIISFATVIVSEEKKNIFYSQFSLLIDSLNCLIVNIAQSTVLKWLILSTVDFAINSCQLIWKSTLFKISK